MFWANWFIECLIVSLTVQFKWISASTDDSRKTRNFDTYRRTLPHHLCSAILWLFLLVIRPQLLTEVTGVAPIAEQLLDISLLTSLRINSIIPLLLPASVGRKINQVISWYLYFHNTQIWMVGNFNFSTLNNLMQFKGTQTFLSGHASLLDPPLKWTENFVPRDRQIVPNCSRG